LDNDYREGFLNTISLKSSEGTSGGVVAAVTILMTVVGIIGSLAVLLLHKNKKIKIPLLEKFN